MTADPSPFPSKPAAPPEAPARNPGFFGPIPHLEGKAMSAIRLGWNVVLSATIGIMIGGVGSWFARGFIEAAIGPLGRGGDLALGIVGWVVGLGAAFVLFASYYLDDKEG